MADNDDTCTICLEGVNWNLGEKEGIVLKCNHAFHVECIFQYAIDEHQCPNCRCDLRTKSTPHQSFSYTTSLSRERHTSIYNQQVVETLFLLLGCLILLSLILCIWSIIMASINHVNTVFSPSSIIITNTTIHVCSSPTNCTTYTAFENASQHAWAILSQAPVFSWHEKVATHGKEFVNLLDECRV